MIKAPAKCLLLICVFLLVGQAPARGMIAPTVQFATQISAYQQGTVASYDAGYDDTTDWTGIPTGTTGAYEGSPGLVTPFYPPFDPNQILVFGIGGHLTLKFNNPVPIKTGPALGVFSTVGLVDSDGNGDVGSTALTFGGGLTTVQVSQNGINWFSLGVLDIDIPQAYYTNAGPYDVVPPSVEYRSNYGLPYTGGLSAFDNKSNAQVLATLNGSAGGTWLNLSSTGLSSIQYVDFSAPTNPQSGWQLAIEAVSTQEPTQIPEPICLLPAIGLLVGWRRPHRRQMRPRRRQGAKEDAKTKALIISSSRLPSRFRVFSVALIPVRKQQAFTLVELLVVIGIIAVLIGLLLPALSVAREQAKTIKCLSNLHQMSIAVELYCGNYHGTYPLSSYSSYVPPLSSSFAWDYTTVTDVTTGIRTLQPGLLWQKSIYSVQGCPSYDGPSNTTIAVPFTGYDYNASYIGGLAPGPGSTTSVCPPMKANQIRQPSKCAIFGDGQYYAGGQAYMRSPFPGPVDIALGFNSPSAGTQGFRHRGKTNAAFCDGHAATLWTRCTQYNPVDSHALGAGTGFLSGDNGAYSGQ